MDAKAALAKAREICAVRDQALARIESHKILPASRALLGLAPVRFGLLAAVAAGDECLASARLAVDRNDMKLTSRALRLKRIFNDAKLVRSSRLDALIGSVLAMGVDGPLAEAFSRAVESNGYRPPSNTPSVSF